MDSRESLLEVTARLYAEHGWRGTTTRRIAEAAGVNEVTLFRQFGSKEALLLEAIGLASDEGGRPTLPAEPKELAAELREWGAAQHRTITELRGLIRSCLAECEEHPELGPRVCDGGRISFIDLTRYLGLARAQKLIGPDGSIEAAALMLINAIFVDAMTRDIMPETHPYPPDQSIELFVDLVLRGLTAKELV